jgi:dTDP-4-amino-4,6-dideoxygalactose transaminase
MKVLNYGKQYIDNKDYQSVRSSLSNEYLTTGPFVKRFENNLKKKLKCEYVATCSSGTAALHLAFKAIDIRKNDIVILPIINFISSANILFDMQAKVYFADVDSSTGQMTPKTFNDCIKKNKIKKVKAFITMYLGGDCKNNILFYNIKKKLKCFMIEDACHALGAKYKFLNNNYSIGSCKHADLSTFSLHPVKSITTGEGGFITTNKKALYNKLILFRSHGIVRKKNKHWDYDIKMPGLNYRLSDLNCSLGISQLKKLNMFMKKRNDIAKKYIDLLRKYEFIELPQINSDIYSSWHLFIVKIDFTKIKKTKANLFKFFLKKKIRLQQHYIPINNFSYYKNKIKGKFRNSQIYYKNSVTLPIHYLCTDKDLKKVDRNLFEFFNK